MASGRLHGRYWERRARRSAQVPSNGRSAPPPPTRYMLMLPEFSDASARYYLNIDFGTIPRLLQTHHSWDITFASETGSTVAGTFRSIAYGSGKLDSLLCIWHHAPQVDVLQLVHFTWRTLARALLYKGRNPRGVSYVKLDLGEPAMRELESLAAQPLWRFLFSVGMHALDIISVESTAMQARFRSFMGHCGHRHRPTVILLPSCGFEVDHVLQRHQSATSGTSTSSSADILYVGRVGAWQKGTDVLLDAFRILSDGLGVPAQLHLVGPLDPVFPAMLERWRAHTSEDTQQRLFTPGPVLDRSALMDAYLTAKVFVISSRYEGIPNSLMEAGSCGCVIVSTPVGQAPDVLRSGIEGWTAPIDDPQALAQALARALRCANGPDERRRRISVFASRYSWPTIVGELAETLLAARTKNAPRRNFRWRHE